MRAISTRLSRRVIQLFLDKILRLFLLGIIFFTFYLMVQDVLRGTLNLYSLGALLICIGIFSSLLKRYAYLGCVVVSVTTLFFIPFILFDLYLKDLPRVFSTILSSGTSLILTFVPHAVLRKRRIPPLGKTLSILVGYIITVLFLFSLTGRAEVPTTNLVLVDLFALLVLVIIYDVALNETYRAVIVQSEIKINVHDAEAFWKIHERLQKRFPRVEQKEISSIVYTIRSSVEFFIHGDFDRTIVESYKAKEGLQRILMEQNKKIKEQDKKNLSDLVEKKRLKELDGWRAKTTHSGIRTKGKEKTDKKEVFSSYEKSVRSLSLVREILEKL
jgi:hypothetical protein